MVLYTGSVKSRPAETLPSEPVYDSIDNNPTNELEIASLRSRAEMRGGESCSTPQLSLSLWWSRAAASFHAGGGGNVGAGPEGEEPPTREEEEEGGRMQANPAYLPIDSYNVPEEERIDMPD